MKDADKRFVQTGKEIEVVFIPQCNTCIYNINISKCTQFDIKPAEYTSNKVVCPKLNKGGK